MAELQVLLMDDVGRRGGERVSSNGENGGGVRGVLVGKKRVSGEGESAIWEGGTLRQHGLHWGQGPVPVFREEVWRQAQRLAVLCNKLEEENRWGKNYTQSRPVLAWGGGTRPEGLAT